MRMQTPTMTWSATCYSASLGGTVALDVLARSSIASAMGWGGEWKAAAIIHQRDSDSVARNNTRQDSRTTDSHGRDRTGRRSRNKDYSECRSGNRRTDWGDFSSQLLYPTWSLSNRPSGSWMLAVLPTSIMLVWAFFLQFAVIIATIDLFSLRKLVS